MSSSSLSSVGWNPFPKRGAAIARRPSDGRINVNNLSGPSITSSIGIMTPSVAATSANAAVTSFPSDGHTTSYTDTANTMPLSSPSLTIATSSSGSNGHTGNVSVGPSAINVSAPPPQYAKAAATGAAMGATSAAFASLSAPTPTHVPSSRGHMYTVVRLTNVRIVRNGRLEFDDLWMNNGKIIDPRERFWHASETREYAADVVIDCKGLIAAPGYIDLQLNGAFGVDFSSPDITQSGIDKIRRGLLAQGVTSFVATVITSSADTYHTVIPKIKRMDGDMNGASLLGLHLEGPFISVLGAHPGPLTRVPARGMADIFDMYGAADTLGDVKIVTLAPELKGAAECVRGLCSRGIVVSAGHTRSSFQQASEAVDAGCTLITHLFNAMQAFHHRDPGLVGLIGTNDRQIFYSLIVDQVHTHPASVKIAYRAHPHGAVLITDAMQAMGLDDGRYTMGSLQIDIVGPTAKIVGSDTLAGSVARLDSCVRNFHSFTSCSIVEAVEAASLHPAQCLKLVNKGHLNVGGDADVILIDDQLNVKATFVAGEFGWAAHQQVIQLTTGADRFIGIANLTNSSRLPPLAAPISNASISSVVSPASTSNAALTPISSPTASPAAAAAAEVLADADPPADYRKP